MQPSTERLVLTYLNRVGHGNPVPMVVIAQGTDRTVQEATHVVRELIRQGRIARHHVGPGDLRYSLLEAFEPEAYRSRRPKPRKRCVRQAPKQAMVLALMSDRSMTVDMLSEATDVLTKDQIRNVLGDLRMKGLVIHTGGRRPYWRAVTTPLTSDARP